MSALHLAEMAAMKTEDPESWKHLQAGEWAPNTSGNEFCCLGADKALEQQNRKLIVTGGIVGITLQPHVLMKYFLIAPYTTKIAVEVHATSGVNKPKYYDHHQLHEHVMKRQARQVTDLLQAIRNFTIPIECERSELMNLFTNRVYSNEIRRDVCQMSTIGEKHLQHFAQGRLIDRSVTF